MFEAGDKVALISGHGHLVAVTTVKRVTTKYVVLSTGRFHRDTGTEVGGNAFNTYRIERAEENHYLELYRKRLIRALTSCVDWEALNLSEIEGMARIAKVEGIRPV